jgi:hypothetical protein
MSLRITFVALRPRITTLAQTAKRFGMKRAISVARRGHGQASSLRERLLRVRARDSWNGSIERERNGGEAILKTPVFRLGHETRAFER